MEAKIDENVAHRGASSTIRTTFGEQVGNFIPVNEGMTWYPVNGNSGQGAQGKQGGFEGGDGIKIRLYRPTTRLCQFKWQRGCRQRERQGVGIWMEGVEADPHSGLQRV